MVNPPILGALMARKPLILYIAAHKCSLGALLTQENAKKQRKNIVLLKSNSNGTITKLLSNRKDLFYFNILNKNAKTLHAGIHGTLIAHAGSIKYMLSKLVLKR